MTYRGRTLPCPVCPALLSEQDNTGVALDVCPDCGGVFIEWFDGEPSQVMRRISAPPGPATLPRGGSGDCPACRTPLTPARYPAPDGAEVLRCGECASTFVPHSSLAILRALQPDSDASESETSALDAVAKVLRRALGWDAR